MPTCRHLLKGTPSAADEVREVPLLHGRHRLEHLQAQASKQSGDGKGRHALALPGRLVGQEVLPEGDEEWMTRMACMDDVHDVHGCHSGRHEELRLLPSLPASLLSVGSL